MWADTQHVQTVPFTTFLFKIASSCNLNCDYCYVYHGPDQSWRAKPKLMSLDVAQTAIQRIAEHVQRHDLTRISVVLHGGEPLLAGITFIERLFKEAKRRIPCDVEFGMQSNLTLLTPDIIDLFDAMGATIGASLDGGREANDRHRVDHAGQTSSRTVESALRTLCASAKGRRLFSGILAVIDLRNDPLAVYDYLASFEPPSLDVLLPDATHERYPFGKHRFQDTVYADWLIRLFDYWWTLPSHCPIRFFDDVLALVLDGQSETENLGLDPVNLIVIETNGSLEAVDTLKIAYHGAPDLGLNVSTASFDDALLHLTVRHRMAGVHSRATACQQCPLLRCCGGGYMPHRFSHKRGFQNPSVYCHDLAKLIVHIRHAVTASLSGRPVPFKLATHEPSQI